MWPLPENSILLSVISNFFGKHSEMESLISVISASFDMVFADSLVEILIETVKGIKFTYASVH